MAGVARRFLGILVHLLIDPAVLLAVPVVALLESLTLLGLPVGRRPRWRAVRLSLFAAVFAWCEWACLVRSLLLWARSPLPARRDLRRWRLAHAALLGSVLGRLVGAAQVLFGLRLHVDGPAGDPNDDRPLIVLSRHAGPGASLVLLDLIIRQFGRAPRIVLKSGLRWDPAVDLLLTGTGAAFLGRRDSTAVVGRLAADLAAGEAMVIFPEGGDWTPARHRGAVERLRRQGRWARARRAQQRPNVLPPRAAGTLAALAAAPQAQVLVVMHTGHDDLLRPGALWRALPLRRELHMSWSAEPRPDVQDEAACVRWLEELWDRINHWVGTHTTGLETTAAPDGGGS